VRQTFPSGGPYENQHGYSRAVRHGNMVFVSGTCARDPFVDNCDAYEQAASALAIIRDALAQAGASLADVVRTVVYVVDPVDAPLVSRAHREAFGDILPASTMVVVRELIDPALKVEIQADAIVGAQV
jgi:enamine deaminase RidA (YjgF/YER057c/UK114 family)